MIRPVLSIAPVAFLFAAACSAESTPADRPAANTAAAPQEPVPVVPENAPVSTIRNVAATTGRANLPERKPDFAVTPIGQFDGPFAMALLPDGRLLVTEKAGTLRLRGTNGEVAGVSGVPRVAVGGQGGLLDVAIAPDFATSRAVYLSYSEGAEDRSQLALARGTLDTAGSPALRNVRVLWRSGKVGPGGQFGAKILFAPDGRSLFLSSGERQRFTPAQDPEQALGKILRLTPDGQPWPGNPQAKAGPESGSVRAATWSMGHRNPYGLAFDAGGRLWEVEMGPKGGDELNLIEPGKNYGWPVVSNGDNYSGQPIPDHPSRPDLAAPALWWNPSISPGGMIVYSGAMFPAWRGSALIAMLGGQGLIRIALDGASARPADQWGLGARIRDVIQAPDGAVWLLEDGEKGAGGRLLRLTPAR